MLDRMVALKRDWIGSPYADFERALLFDEDKEHWGWFEWLEGGRDRIFTLSKSPFLKAAGVPVYYIIPEGRTMSLPVSGQFVQVDVRGLPHVEYYPDRFKTYEVENIRLIADKDLLEILPRPRLSLDEFRHYCTINFDNAEKDNLDIVMPLQIVSCPENEFGKGGITVMRTSFLHENDSAVKSFKNGILDQIPSGFKRENPAYMYRAMTGKGEDSEAKLLKNKCKELNLLVNKTTRLDIHIPIIQSQSIYRFRQPLSSDVVSYQLTSLICRPSMRREDIRHVENIVKKARKRIEKSSVPFNMNPMAAVKVAEAMARMKLVQNNAMLKWLSSGDSLIESQLKVQEDLFNDVWKSQVEAFADLKDMYDGIELKNVKVGKKNRSLKTGHFNSELSRRDVSIMVHLRKISRETGNMNVRWEDLKASMEIDDARLAESLHSLRNYGYVIMFDNHSLIRLLDLDEYSDAFDQALPD